MLHYIKGTMVMRIEGGVVVENGGIGYEIYVPDNSAVYLLHEGDPATLYLSMIVREDDVSLYGFSDSEGLSLFKMLITVNGIGAKAAMAILSVAPVQKIKEAILFEDADFLTRASGVGKKTAQRVVLELRDKIGSLSPDLAEKLPEQAEPTALGARNEAIAALVALGYSRTEATSAVAVVQGDGLTSEEYIKRALSALM